MTQKGERSSVQWAHELKVDGTVTFRTGRRGATLIADWPGLGRLAYAADGGISTLTATAGVPPSVLRKLERGPVRALLHEVAGGLAVHASGVALNGRAVLFLGASGAGKSTAAAEMCLRHGASILADDVALLDVHQGFVHLLPGEDEHWLTGDSRLALGVAAKGRDKRSVRAKRVGDAPCRLGLVVALRFQPGACSSALRTVRGSDAARRLLEAALRFDVDDGTARRRELEQITTVYKSARFFELVRPVCEPPGVAAFVLDALEDRVS